MKLRHIMLFLASAMLLAAGCGSDSDDKSGDDKPKTKAEEAMAKDAANKEKQVKAAQKEFKKDDKDVGACRNLAMAYIAKASPASSPDPKKPIEPPKDREDSLKKAVGTLEDCVSIDEQDRDVKQMLASTYMATSAYDKATPLLEQLAKGAKGPERPNAYYAWGLAASNAQQYDDAIAAWQRFVQLSPKNDPRIKQVQQSIVSLRAAQKAEKQAPAQPEAEEKATDEGEDGEEG